jgi:phospholipid/cholesterol/gamma-HCH transport system substrate-binding protein
VKAFTDRNPRRLGLVALVAMALVVTSVIVLNRGLFQSTYPVTARFANAAGITKGTKVLVAGVDVGSVSSVRVDGNSVIATLDINHGTVLPAHTAASIQVETLLGIEDVSLKPIGGWAHPLAADSMITDTSVPVQIYQLQNSAGHLLTQTDAAALNSLVEELASITQGKEAQVKAIINGLAGLTTTVDQRSGEVSQLIDAANQVSSTLAGRDQQLVSLIDSLNTVVGGLAANSGNLGSLIDNIDQMATQTAGLVGQDTPQLNALLQNLNQVMGVVSAHQLDLAEGISYLASGLKGFASVGYSGPNDYPNSWANIYTNPVTLAGAYGILGPCGALDQALTAALGPDPLPCAEQTGPLPGSTGATGSAGPTTGGTGGTGGTTAGPNSGVGGLSQLFGPIAGTGAP